MKLDEIWIVRTRDAGPGTPFVFSARCTGRHQPDFTQPMWDHEPDTVALMLEDLTLARVVKGVIFQRENDAPLAWLRKNGIKLISRRRRELARQAARTEETGARETL